MITRRQFAGGCAGMVAAAVFRPRCTRGCNGSRLAERIDEAISRAIGFLAARQSADGAWRSEIYGPLKDGPSLTAFIAATLAKLASHGLVQPILGKALAYLASVEPHAAEITYPVYAAAGAVVALSRQSASGSAAARDGWVNFLREQQLVERLGWNETDDSFGGWSFAHQPPVPIHGKPASPLAVPNLSATVFALDALRAGGCSVDDPAVRRAREFVQRCQNWSDDESARDGQFDDGGFFFLQGDPIRNKPGEAGIDSFGRIRYLSYGSATADGLRALLACGLALDHPRVRAARRWLARNFSPETHPGSYPADREHLRAALYFYFAASASEALYHCRNGHGEHQLSSWASALSEALLGRQRVDGSWANTAVDVREDDPFVATPLAVSSLVSCQARLSQLS